MTSCLLCGHCKRMSQIRAFVILMKLVIKFVRWKQLEWNSSERKTAFGDIDPGCIFLEARSKLLSGHVEGWRKNDSLTQT